jgi:hypothetical protein
MHWCWRVCVPIVGGREPPILPHSSTPGTRQEVPLKSSCDLAVCILFLHGACMMPTGAYLSYTFLYSTASVSLAAACQGLPWSCGLPVVPCPYSV